MLQRKNSVFWALAMLALVGSAFVSTGCRRPRDGNDGSSARGPVSVVPPSDTTLTDAEDLPGLVITVIEVGGSSGDAFQVGDEVSVRFTIERNDHSALPIGEVDRFEANISGPTFNYQRVIAKINVIPEAGVIDESVEYNDDGSYTYTFPPLPENYLDPPNYLATNTTDVLAGTPLLSGTYTFVFTAYKNYTAGTKVIKDVENLTYDFLFGDADTLAPREVVTTENCNRCHDTVQNHDRGLPGGGRRRDTKACVTCHVAGAEDMNDPDVAGGTPGVTTEFKVMIHKIHNGFHLPSVQGLKWDSTITGLNYNSVPVPYELVNDELEILDFSDVLFPVFPAFNIAMPRNFGWTQDLAVWDPVTGKFLDGTPAVVNDYNGIKYRTIDDNVRKGITDCAKCHGDPDGDAGPLPAPAQGNLAFVQPSRRACGSCHDDIDWTTSYTVNGLTMPPQADDSECITCHVGTGDSLDTVVAHRHPLQKDASIAPPVDGFNIHILSVTPSLAGLPGYLEPGEKMSVTIEVKDDAGMDLGVSPAGLSNTPLGFTPTPVNAFSCVVSGPTYNYNALLYVGIPTDLPVFNGGVVPGTPTYTFNLPQFHFLADVGNGGVDIDGVVAGVNHNEGAPFPIYTNTLSAIDVREVTAFGVGSTLAAAANPGQNFVDVVHTGVPANDFTTASRGNYVMIELVGSTSREFLRIGSVEVVSPTVDRVYFTSPYQQSAFTNTGTNTFTSFYGPWIRKAHAAAAPIVRITLTARTTPANWSLTGYASPVAGQAQYITETAGFGAGNPILVTYTTDWVVPSYFPPAFFGSEDLGETFGAWWTKPVTPGTYTVGIWGMYGWNYADPAIPPFVRPPDPDGPGPLLGYTGIDYEVLSYRMTSPPSDFDFLMANTTLPSSLAPTPTEIEPYPTLSSFENCNVCHNDIRFHGGSRRGFGTCIMCHGTAGLGIVQNYTSNPPYAVHPTGPDNTANFRTGLHAWHDNVFAHGPGPVGEDEEPGLPTMPGGSMHCAKCHGEVDFPALHNTFEVPRDRNHPTAQVAPVREWAYSCGGCHSNGDARAHFSLMTSSAGEESCGVCHGIGATYSVKDMHRVR